MITMYSKDGVEVSAAVNQIDVLKAAGYSKDKPKPQAKRVAPKKAAVKPATKTNDDLDI